MKVVIAGSYSEAGLAALADATYDQRRAAMDEVYSACGGKIINYFFCDGDAVQLDEDLLVVVGGGAHEVRAIFALSRGV